MIQRFSKIILLSGTLLSGTLTLAGVAVAADNNQMWLAKMNDAVHSLNYSGTYVHINNGQIETMQIVHHVGPDGEKERLFSLNGEAREILRDSKQVTCILPANRKVVIGNLTGGSTLPALVPENVIKLDKLYDIELIGKDRIANYPTIILTIQPKDKMRYGYRIWLEEDSGMVLRSDILDTQGRIVEQMMFTEISLQSPVTVAMLQPTVPHEGFQTIISGNHGAAEEAARLSWRFNSMPQGFSVTRTSRKQMPMKKHMVEHIVLSDGLATVSVYIEKVSGKDVFKGASKMGGVNAYGRQVNNHQVTVMGEVPPETVQQIADSVAYDK